MSYNQYNLKMDNRIIVKVKKSKIGQMRVTIPSDSEINDGDYVEVKKLKGDKE